MLYIFAKKIYKFCTRYSEIFSLTSVRYQLTENVNNYNPFNRSLFSGQGHIKLEKWFLTAAGCGWWDIVQCLYDSALAPSAVLPSSFTPSSVFSSRAPTLGTRNDDSSREPMDTDFTCLMVTGFLVLSTGWPGGTSWLEPADKLPGPTADDEEVLVVVEVMTGADDSGTFGVGALSLSFVMDLADFSFKQSFLSRCSLRSWSKSLLRPGTARRRLSEWLWKDTSKG